MTSLRGSQGRHVRCRRASRQRRRRRSRTCRQPRCAPRPRPRALGRAVGERREIQSARPAPDNRNPHVSFGRNCKVSEPRECGVLSMPASIHFADLTSPRARALLDAGPTPVLLLPVGAVEPHGPHAPLGTDSIISAAICERAALALAGTGRPGAGASGDRLRGHPLLGGLHRRDHDQREHPAGDGGGGLRLAASPGIPPPGDRQQSLRARPRRYAPPRGRGRRSGLSRSHPPHDG